MSSTHRGVGRFLHRALEETYACFAIGHQTTFADGINAFRAKVDIHRMNSNGFHEPPAVRHRLMRKHAAVLEYLEKTMGDYFASTGFSGNPVEDLLHILFKPLTTSIATDRWACSSVAAAHMFGKHASYVFVPSSIDIREFEFSVKTRRMVRERLGIASDTVCVGHVGNFYRQKNHVRLIRMFARFHQMNRKSVLLLVGSGDKQHTQELHRLCRELGISDSVIFYGQSDRTADMYNAMDVFLFPSLYEGLGMVLIEAQANGLPCVVSSTIPLEADSHTGEPFIRCDLKESDSRWANAIMKVVRSQVDRVLTGSKLEDSQWDLSQFGTLMSDLLLNWCTRFQSIKAVRQ